ncbi:MAG: hypothetical protein Q8R98_09670 [Rubrivivax sp.]|nr:hypothetical protein [Rubrivivax sp.]MDP3612108.1 hypothetical protein [Rubrivivax sp.]
MARTFAAFAAAVLFLALAACSQAPIQPPCKPPEAVHLLIDPDTGQPVVPRWVATLRDGVDWDCTGDQP